MPKAYFVGKTFVDRLFRRFSLADTPLRSGQFQVPGSIIPVTDADRLMKDLVLSAPSNVSVTGTGGLVIDTVPVGKSRRYYAVKAELATGTFTMIYFGLMDPAPSGSVIRVKTLTQANTIYYYPIDGPFQADAGWRVMVGVDTLAVAGTLEVRFLYEEEDTY